MVVDNYITSVFILIISHLTRYNNAVARITKPVPPKLDIGFIMDFTPRNNSQTFIRRSLKLMGEFANHLSVSPGTTRFAVVALKDAKVNTHFLFQDCVNRECLLKNINKLYKVKSSSANKRIQTGKFRRFLKKGIGVLRSSSNLVSDQRCITLILTSSSSILKTLDTIRSAKSHHVQPILIGSHEKNRTDVGSKFFEYKNITDFDSLREKLGLKPHVYSSCNVEGSVVKDECNRVCSCVNGTLQKCFRIRKEFTEMGRNEQRR